MQTSIHEKAPWHLEFNNGLIPVLETPSGDLIKESAIIAQIAIEAGGDQGVQLIPKDPIAAAKMRLEIEAFKNKITPLWSVLWPAGEYVGMDDAATDKFGKEILPYWESLCAKTSDDKWLFGTAEPTLLDVTAAPFFEIIYCAQFGVLSNVTDRLNVKQNAPNLLKYVERWQAHPLIHPQRMRVKAANAHWVRSRGWEKGVKAQLSIEILESGAFDD